MLHFCVSGAFQPIDHYVPVAKAAEAAGFRYMAVSDHLAHPEKIESPYPYTPDGGLRWEPFTTWPDPMVAIGAMGAPSCIAGDVVRGAVDDAGGDGVSSRAGGASSVRLGAAWGAPS